MKHGEGTFTWADGRVYQGQWRAGKQDGAGHLSARGTLFTVFTRIFESKLKKGQRAVFWLSKFPFISFYIIHFFWSSFLQPAPAVTQGVLIDTNGRQTKGHWRMGERLRSPEGWGAPWCTAWMVTICANNVVQTEHELHWDFGANTC